MTTQRWLTGTWIVGGTLIGLGVLALLINFGLVESIPVWKLWPSILIALGVARILRPHGRSEGFWLVAMGIWMQISLLRIWGLGFGETWPALLIALGIFWVWSGVEKGKAIAKNT